jgi:uncharacterized protein (TIGR02284 family)
MYNLETIDRLLQNELSATETYQQVFEKFQDNHEINSSEQLMPIYKSHQDAVSVLQAHIRELGGTPAEHSSVWQTWSKIVQGGAHKLGKQTVLSILQQGEKIAAEDYQKVLWNTQLPSSIRCLIEWKLLLIQKSHTRVLDKLLSATTV